MTERDPNHVTTDSSPETGATGRPAPSAERAETHRVTSGGSAVARWGIALIVVALVIGVVAAGVFLLTGRDEPGGLAYVPADSVGVVELRPDLPGDQRQNLGALLSKFPGFADQANLEEKIDEALDRLVATASDGEVSYADDVKPFLAGPAIIAFPSLPASDEAELERWLVIATTSADVTCEDRFGVVATTEEHRGRTLLISDGREMGRTACVDADPHLIVGDVDSVKGALDTKDSGDDVTTATAYQAAEESLPGDRLGFMYLDGRALAQAVEEAGEENPLGGLAPDQTPEWAAFRLSVQEDALVMDFAMPNPGQADGASAPPRTAPPSKVSTLAPRLPATTVAAFESHGWGVGILNAVDAARADPDVAAELQQLEQAALLLGGVEGLFGWMGDGTIVVTRDGTEVGGGLVVEAANPADAEARLDQLKGVLLLGGASLGITIEDVQHGDATITIVDLGDLGGIVGELGAPIGGDPIDVQVAYTVHDGLVVFGAGRAFVEAVLDTESGSSLADQPAYRRAIDAAGATNDAQGYADLSALAELAAEQLDGEEAQRYETDVKPYIEPLDGIGIVVGRSGDLVVGRMVIIAN